MHKLFLAEKMKETLEVVIEILVERGMMQEAQALRVAEFVEPWRPGMAYGNNHWLSHGKTGEGRAQLWTTTKNVAAGQSPPDQNNAYKKIV